MLFTCLHFSIAATVSYDCFISLRSTDVSFGLSKVHLAFGRERKSFFIDMI